MKHKSFIAFSAALLLGASINANAFSQIIFEDFNEPDKASNAGSTSFLGTGGTGINYNDNFGTWIYAPNGGIDDPATGLGDGSSTNDRISSIGLARPQEFRGGNARAIYVVYAGSNFIDGQTYTISFDVIGDPDGNEGVGRLWLAELYGYDTSGDNYIQMAGNYNGWGNAANRPFTGVGDATANYLLGDIERNGELVSGVAVAGTNSSNSYTFTYDATNSPDIGFSVGTFNNVFGINNLSISEVPEPSSYALIAGLLVMGSILVRRRR
ncbi:MAG: PEP-CTERM sorting domain-containing protein [Puniceicoccaceae bacterium]|nr:MAG: PEP-CTERM sorting domain-containing protein [Puniceicoccaceae bacterium]